MNDSTVIALKYLARIVLVIVVVLLWSTVWTVLFGALLTIVFSVSWLEEYNEMEDARRHRHIRNLLSEVNS
jgi:hypothetical protein